jgi:hypothetical protein
MNRTANQLYHQYQRKLLWITMHDGSMIIGQFVGLTGMPLPGRNEPEDITVCIVQNLAAFFSDKSAIPMEEHRTIRPSQIFDICVLDWNETGGAKQLSDLSGLHLVRVKKTSGNPITGVVLGFRVPHTAYKPFEEVLYIYELQSLKQYAEYVKYVTDPKSGTRAIHPPRQICLGEIADFEILRHRSVAAKMLA